MKIKTTIAAALALLFAGIAYADRTPDEIVAEVKNVSTNLAWNERNSAYDAIAKGMTLNEWKAMFDTLIDDSIAHGVLTNKDEGIKSGCWARFDTKMYNTLARSRLCPSGDEFRAEYDDKIKAFVPGGMYWYLSGPSWSNTLDYISAEYGFATNYPTVTALKKKYFGIVALAKDGTLDELISYFVEMQKTDFITMKQNNQFKKYIKEKAVKAIKRALRQKGQSFVEKDGVNPIEQPLSQLVDALNAPRFAGLDTWCKTWAPNAIKVEAACLPDEENLQKIKDNVFYGEVEFNERRKVILSDCLGVEAYNQFVKEYNGTIQ